MSKQAVCAVSLLGLDPLDEIDTNDPNSCSLVFYAIRLGQNGDAVPATFTDRRAEAMWAGIFGAKVFGQLIIDKTQPQVPSGNLSACMPSDVGRQLQTGTPLPATKAPAQS